MNMLYMRFVTFKQRLWTALITLSLSACATTEPHPAFDWPAQGKIIAGFGDEIDGRISEGIYIEVKESGPQNGSVHASADGIVQFSQDWAPIGNVMVIGHGDSWHTLYIGVDAMRPAQGETVSQGDTIATVALSPDTGKRVLSFEIRYNGEPIDPQKIIRRRLPHAK